MNEQVGSLWRLNLDPKSVRSGIGGSEFPSAYDIELLNIASAGGVADSCIVLLGRCMAMVDHLKKVASEAPRFVHLKLNLRMLSSPKIE